LGDGDTLLFLETKSGALVLKPVKAKPEMDLIDHLLRFKDLEIPERTPSIGSRRRAASP
jgi:hypothetical protein